MLSELIPTAVQTGARTAALDAQLRRLEGLLQEVGRYRASFVGGESASIRSILVPPSRAEAARDTALLSQGDRHSESSGDPPLSARARHPESRTRDDLPESERAAREQPRSRPPETTL